MSGVTLADIGVIGLAVMGENLVLNLESRGFSVACYNRTFERVEAFVQGRARGKQITGYPSLAELAGHLSVPRRVLMMVRAGDAVDALIEQLLPVLQSGDVLIDGGNSYHRDTQRRIRHLEKSGILYVGMGVSGGEEGALKGPSLMPGGSPGAWPLLKDILQSIAARTARGEACCDWIGPDGAGHFVKMVHNGIEYGDMQLIAEAYDLMKHGYGLSNADMSRIFRTWNEGVLNSYLIEITADILAYQDQAGTPVLDTILDSAGQKGTGRWMVTDALDLAQPLTLITEAVFARHLSAMLLERRRAAAHLSQKTRPATGDVQQRTSELHDALYASKIVSYAQGFQMLRAASEEYHWSLNLGRIAQIWRGGCVIRSVFLDRINEAYDDRPDLHHLMMAPFFSEALQSGQAGWRNTVTEAVQRSIPIPAFSAALAYYDGYHAARLPANLIQAQRDYFGAHRYERIDAPRGEFFHTDWTGRGGSTVSGSYSV